MANKVLEICTSCSNHNKKIGLRRPDGGTRFTCDIQPKWMFCGKHEEPRQIDCKRGKEWTNVNMPKVNSMLFTHGKGAGDIGIWHKQIGHVNIQRLKLMEKQNLVGGLPKFGTEEVMSEVCEAC
jgi:hypothetical protein